MCTLRSRSAITLTCLPKAGFPLKANPQKLRTWMKSGAPTSVCNVKFRARSCSLFYWQPRLHPSLLAFWIVRHVGVTHGRQFTGGVFAGVSMRVGTIRNDLNIFIGQQLRREFFYSVRRNIHCSGNVGVAITFRCKRLYYLDRFLTV